MLGEARDVQRSYMGAPQHPAWPSAPAMHHTDTGILAKAATAQDMPRGHSESLKGRSCVITASAPRITPALPSAPAKHPPPTGSLFDPPVAQDMPRGHSECLKGRTFVITGVLDSLKRSQAEDFIKRHSGRVTGSISSRTSFLVVGLNCGRSKTNQVRVLQAGEQSSRRGVACPGQGRQWRAEQHHSVAELWGRSCARSVSS